jgi:hypothetical protein
MSTTILINKNSERGAELDSLVEQLKQVLAKFAQTKRELDQTAMNSDFQSVLNIYGLYNLGDAEAVYNLIGSVNLVLQSDSFIGQLTSRI